ncbi:MAG: HigA family addiction module antitoxin [Tepidiformaceae bacterium]
MPSLGSVWPDIAIHPGETLEEELGARGMTQKDLAQRLGKPPQAVNEIVRRRKGISAEMAIALEGALGISRRFWMTLQSDYELTLAHHQQQSPGRSPER